MLNLYPSIFTDNQVQGIPLLFLSMTVVQREKEVGSREEAFAREWKESGRDPNVGAMVLYPGIGPDLLKGAYRSWGLRWCQCEGGDRTYLVLREAFLRAAGDRCWARFWRPFRLGRTSSWRGGTRK